MSSDWKNRTIIIELLMNKKSQIDGPFLDIVKLQNHFTEVELLLQSWLALKNNSKYQVLYIYKENYLVKSPIAGFVILLLLKQLAKDIAN